MSQKPPDIQPHTVLHYNVINDIPCSVIYCNVIPWNILTNSLQCNLLLCIQKTIAMWLSGISCNVFSKSLQCGSLQYSLLCHSLQCNSLHSLQWESWWFHCNVIPYMLQAVSFLQTVYTVYVLFIFYAHV